MQPHKNTRLYPYKYNIWQKCHFRKKFVRENGIKIYPINELNPINPEEAVSLLQSNLLSQ